MYLLRTVSKWKRTHRAVYRRGRTRRRRGRFGLQSVRSFSGGKRVVVVRGMRPKPAGSSEWPFFSQNLGFYSGFFFFCRNTDGPPDGLNLSRVSSSPEIHGRSRACAVVSFGMCVCACVAHSFDIRPNVLSYAQPNAIIKNKPRRGHDEKSRHDRRARGAALPFTRKKNTAHNYKIIKGNSYGVAVRARACIRLRENTRRRIISSYNETGTR